MSETITFKRFREINDFIHSVLNNNLERVKEIDDLSLINGQIFLENNTALNIAIFNDNYPLFELLLLNGADPDIGDSSGSTPLHYACYLGKIEMVKLLLRNGANINAVSEDKTTPLILASEVNNTEVMKILLSQPGINILYGDDDNNFKYWIYYHLNHEIIMIYMRILSMTKYF